MLQTRFEIQNQKQRYPLCEIFGICGLVLLLLLLLVFDSGNDARRGGGSCPTFHGRSSKVAQKTFVRKEILQQYRTVQVF